MCEVTILFPIEITWPHAKKSDFSADAAQHVRSVDQRPDRYLTGRAFFVVIPGRGRILKQV
jgi:hypothetical protein